ncbi:MAG: DNA methyltransferase [Sediminibacterium sp.]|nr:DNA methyltransferase [Sediminibacterium sp.]
MSNRIIKEMLFGTLDFSTIENDAQFKEDSVREMIILPILKELGYSQENIVRSKSLQHPFLKIGSRNRPITLIPDYALKVKNNFAWVLDAKAPNQKIINNANVEQVYSYAAHPEIRSNFFALCNGIEFSVYKTTETNKPVLHFKIEEIEINWNNLKLLLAPTSFQEGKKFSFETHPEHIEKFDYNKPLLKEIPVKKQASKRHFGVHGYFTKQSWNVVAEYIKQYSQPGDLVLDPFSGSGITAIEALMNRRKAINIDINPFAVFLVQSLVAPVNFQELQQSFEEVKKEYLKKEPKTKQEIKLALKKYKGPKKLSLPKGSDVDTVEKLFSDTQLTQLALLKSIILKQKNHNIKQSLMLMFSGVITRVNLTYHISKSVKANTGFGGNAAAFQYYRYRIAKEPTKVNVLECFEMRFNKVKDAKKEMEYFINDQTISNLKIVKGTATNLSFIENESVDYIYTDPPYGKKIPYLDLSAMWNAWLDLDVSEQDYKDEAIEGGECNKSKDEYNDLMAQSIKEMYRVLKFDRWLSFVFAHKDPEFWHLIVDTAESCGFEYVGAVPQKNGQTSFKKRQNPFTVLSGQLIINFRKVRNPRTILKANLGMNMAEIVMQTIEGIIAKNNGANLEQINDELIIKGLELGFLDLLKKEYSDLTPLLLDKFDYNEHTELFTIKKNTKFTTQIDIKLRIKYYLISYLRRMELEKKSPHFDEIVLYIIPLLKNGMTPENQTILSVLEDIGERTHQDCWRLKRTDYLTLFD